MEFDDRRTLRRALGSLAASVLALRDTIDRLRADMRLRRTRLKTRASGSPITQRITSPTLASPCRNCGTPLTRISRNEIATTLTCPVCGLPYEPSIARLRLFNPLDFDPNKEEDQR
jgi:hypothetical protein